MSTDFEIYEKVFVLCDCNNFFVSCEKIFRPDLKNRPVLVLSNNDGIVVSRSYESKAIGIPMGVPVFKIQKEIRKYSIKTFSSNFNLYLDISNRVMKTLETFCKDIEIYSVDEAFLCFECLDEKATLELAYKIKNTIATQIGIPIGIGIARSKTLAKLASEYAKKNPLLTGGVYSVLSNDKRQKILLNAPIADVWGIGKKLNEHLREDGFVTAYDLSKANLDTIRKKYSIVTEKTVRELNNIACVENSSNFQDQNQIMWSRTFKDKITSFDDIYEALSNYVAEATAKLRSLNKYSKKITVFIRTSFFGNNPKYANEGTIILDFPCADTRVFLYAAKMLLQHIYKPNYEYMKAGVILSDFVEDRTFQADLFNYLPDSRELDKSDKLMNAIDSINKGAKNSIYIGAQNKLTKDTKFNGPQHLSPKYTCSWKELPEVF